MTSEPRYSAISTLNHWITALLVIAMLTLGVLGDNAPSEEVEHYVMNAHFALGFFTAVFVFWRVGYRLYEGFIPSAAPTKLEGWMAHLVQGLILLTLLGLVISGPLYLFTEGEAIDVFGWFSVGLPLSSLEVLHEPAEAVHKFLASWVLVALLLLHVGGAVLYFMRRQYRTPADL